MKKEYEIRSAITGEVQVIYYGTLKGAERRLTWFRNQGRDVVLVEAV